MKQYIVINKSIYEKYKDEILPLNARLFTTPFFYSLKSYQDPLDLTGLLPYFQYIEEIVLYSGSTFIDYVNILLILDFFKRNDFKGKVTIKYYIISPMKNDVFSYVTLKNEDYINANKILNSLVNNEKIENNEVKLPGALNYINFYNNLIDDDRFNMCFEDIIDEYDEDIDLIVDYFYSHYSNMGLSKEFYYELISKYL